MRLHSLLSAALLAFVLALAACDNADPVDDDDDDPPPPPATTGTLTGTISLPPGTAGSVSNARVALFETFDDWNNDRFAYQTAADGSGNYTIANVVPGTYYMDAWKDNNNNQGFPDAGDFYGVWGSLSGAGTTLTPIPIAAGQTVTVSFVITQLAEPLWLPKVEVTE